MPIEYKTIRIPATAYYKLVELTGLMSAALGYNFSISDTASWTIQNTHQQYYERLTKVVSNPSEVKKIREQMAGQIQDIMDVWKNVRIRE